jgi:23S rRNA pseudouridine2457 synthase
MKYYVFNKPFQVLSQFSSEEGKRTLSDFLNIDKDCYPIGRLDYDSEGLIIISNDKKLNDYLLNPINKHKREYVVQVEGNIQNSDIDKLKSGVNLNIKGKNHFAKCVDAQIINDYFLPERASPIRFRANIPTSIIKLSLTEGKNRQVRKMTAAIGFPTLRLIRVSIENLKINGINSGEFIQLNKEEIYKMLKISNIK